MAPTRNDEQIDPISAASAGMLALGVKADKRAHALGLLAEMIDRADHRGLVKFDDELMTMERRLGVSKCLDSYSWLEATGVVRRTHNGWTIPAIGAHSGPVGATATSMAVLAHHLEMNAAEITPIGAARAERDFRAVARRLPVMAGSIAAAAAAILGLVSFANKPDSPDHANDLASRSGALSTDAPSLPGTNIPGANDAAAPAPAPSAPSVGGTIPRPITGSATAVASGDTNPLECLLPDIKILAVDFTFGFDVLTGPTWTALVAGTVTNVDTQTASLDALRVALDLGNGAIAEGTGLLPSGELAPGHTGTFSALVPLGAERPTIATPTVTPTNWKSGGC